MSIFRRLLAGATAGFVLLAALHTADAQQTTAAMRGDVEDLMGRPIANAAVMVTNTNTGAILPVTTSGTGIFNLSELPIGGPYTVRVEAPGFTPKTVEGVFLTLGETARVDIRLDQAPEQVVVIGTALATATETIETHGVASNFTAANIAEQPLVSRDFKEIIQQSPYAYIDPVGGGNTHLFRR